MPLVPRSFSSWLAQKGMRFLATYAPWDDFWYTATPGRKSGIAGITVSPESALTHAAVWACTGLLEEGLSSVPLHLHRRLDDGGKERAVTHPLYWKLAWQPNPWQTAPEYESLAMNHVLMRGNFYAEILEEPQTGEVTALIPLHPDRVQGDLLPLGQMQYRYKPPQGVERIIPQRSMHHRRGRTFDGITGVSVITYGARTLGVAMADAQYAGNFFNGPGAPPFVISSKLTLGDAGQKNLRQSIDQYTKGGGYLVLEEDMTAVPLGISPRDAQLLEARQFDVEEVARMFNVPLHLLKVNKAGTVSYASVEMFDIDYVKHTLRPWAVRFEKAVWRDLLSEREQKRYVPEYLLDALMRGDAASRVAMYKSGIFTVNEARAIENLNPVPGGERMLEGQPTREPEPPGSRDPKGRPRAFTQAVAITEEAARRIVRKELHAVHKAATRYAGDAAGWQAWLHTFYGDHAVFVAEVLQVDRPVADHYAETQRAQVARAGVQACETWERDRPAVLVALALGETNGSLQPDRGVGDNPALGASA